MNNNNLKKKIKKDKLYQFVKNENKLLFLDSQ